MFFGLLKILYTAQCFEIIHFSHGFEIIACLYIFSPKCIVGTVLFHHYIAITWADMWLSIMSA